MPSIMSLGDMESVNWVWDSGFLWVEGSRSENDLGYKTTILCAQE